MWHKAMGKVSKTIRDDYPHDFDTLYCMQFRPNLSLKHGLPAPSGGTAFVLIKPDSYTLALHVLANESYHATLSKMGDVVDSEFDFSEVTGKNLFVAVHKNGHFFEKIDTKSLMEEILTYAYQHDCAFLLQLDSVDLNLSPLHRRISNELQKIRTPRRVKDEKGYHTEDHPEKGGDLDRDGDKILDSLKSGPCSSVVLWCFSKDSPRVGFFGSTASASWVNVDSDVISRNVTIKNKIRRWLLRRPKNCGIGDIFNSEDGAHSMIRFLVNGVLTKETERYLTKRKNSPVFLFDGNVQLYLENVQSSRSVDSPNQTRPESLEDVGY